MTVIDMTSGELICSGTAVEVKHPDPAARCRDEPFVPSLALQEMQPERSPGSIPPELVDIPAAAILARFE